MSAKKVSKVAEPKIVKLVHRFTTRGAHRLEIHDPIKAPVIGEWSDYKGIAIIGDMRGTTDFHKEVLPRTFRVVPIDAHEVTE